MDPAYENSRCLTPKSDVYSFGVLLFEVLFGREACVQNNDNWYFAHLARSCYEDQRLDDFIDPDLRRQMNLQSLNIFVETAYYCLEEKRSQRSDMSEVLSKLEKALELQRKNEHPITHVVVESTLPANHLKGKTSNQLKFQLRDIELATNKFSETCCIGSGGYGKVYKAQLNLDETINSSKIKGKSEDKLPKKHSTVAIKRIFSRHDKQGEQGFLAEIKMLCNCKHPNIVSLQGFCDEEGEMILVYEYVSNGSLEDYLENIGNLTSLTWAQRIQMCLDIAHGLKYLHTSTEDKDSIIHRDIKSANILIDGNWVAKIADFGLSKLHNANQQGSTLVTNNIDGTEVYLDPKYQSIGKLKTDEHNIYSFGVVMFEIMCGKLAYDNIYGQKGLPSIVRQRFNEGTLNNLVDPKLVEADENILNLIGGVDQDSLDTFTKIGYQCLAETQTEPNLKLWIRAQNKMSSSSRSFMDVNGPSSSHSFGYRAQKLQYDMNVLYKSYISSFKIGKDNLQISLKDIKLGTQTFSDCSCIVEGRFWKLYEGEVARDNECITIFAKRWDRKSHQGHIQFLTELDLLSWYKHESIIALVGYCIEMDESIIVYEHVANGRLNKYLGDPSLTWMKCLKICINVAQGLEFFHEGDDVEDKMVHRDIRSGSILLDGDWNAKISNFEMSRKLLTCERAEHVKDNACDSLGYVDPEYQHYGFLTQDSDVYSLGVILLEMLCGRLAWAEGCEDHSQSLGPSAKRHHKEKGSLEDMIFEGIMERIEPQSLLIFQNAALRCLEEGNNRPYVKDVVKQLEKALEVQVTKLRQILIHLQFDIMSSSSEDTSVMSMVDYVDFLEIPFEEIESATNNFAVENLLTQGSSFKVYKGQLLQQSGDFINIVARTSTHRRIVFNELKISKYIKHKNIVSIYKLTSTTNDEVIIINKIEANGSLDKHLSDPTLTWMQRLQICVGVAQALKYLHNDALDNHYIIHGNIKSSKILLDHNWEPKLHGFGCGCRYKKHLLHLTKYNGSAQYMDPEYENSRGLTPKSDVYSFGVLLFEVLFGREACIQNSDNWYFARLARSCYEGKTLDGFIDPDLRRQMNLQSLNIFVETAYYCLEEKRSQRSDMSEVLSKLEKALELQHKHVTSSYDFFFLPRVELEKGQNDPHEHPNTHAVMESTLPANHLKGKTLNQLRFQLRDIELVTDKFSETCCIGSGGFGKVYKAQLNLDETINSSKKGKSEDKLPKKHSTVAIKRIFSRHDKQGEQSFLAEIKMLCNCKHPNIVSLQGFCDEEGEMILVYEYASNGSFADYLENIDNVTSLTWAQRIQICLDIAHGLKYLHTSTEDKDTIIHRDIKSANILIDGNWVAKIADFGLSKLHNANQQGSTFVTNNIAGTEVYLDPEYLSTGKLKTKSDIYSFGVVMFEIMCGKLAYDNIYGQKGLPSRVQQRFNEGTLNNLVDPKLVEADENILNLIGGVDQDSLDTFTKIGYQCLAETQAERPTMEVIIQELKKALNFQKIGKDNLQISVKDIKLGTQTFSDCSCIFYGRFWKLYDGEVARDDECIKIFVKRWDRKSHQGHIQFLTELDLLSRYKHENIIALVGYCIEMDENIIVYEHAANGKLDKFLGDPSLTWMKRLKICIDVAKGLEFFHKGDLEDNMVHRDIRSASILLDGDWNAKISNFEMSCKLLMCERAEHVEDNACHSLGYVDPEYQHNRFLTQDSDVYSLCVILLEMLCGRLAWAKGCEDHSHSLGPSAKRHRKEKGSLDDMIFEGIMERIDPLSLLIFQNIALECLEERSTRPYVKDVVKQLEKALKFQVSCFMHAFI
ncbi:hypothetical protein R6Q59_019363 [Mikania micrantha]